MKRYLFATLFLVMFPTLMFAQRDIVELSNADPTTCCFEMLLANEHAPESSLDRVRLVSLTPGVQFTPDANGPWPEHLVSETVLEFGEEGNELPTGELLEGFLLCIERLPGAPSNFRVAWTTEFEGNLMDTDTLELQCESMESYCDSVSVLPFAPPIKPEGSCCFDITLHNLHDPEGALNRFTVRMFDPRATIVSVSGSPWPVADQSATEVTFKASGDSLATGMSLGGFRICISPPDGQSASVPLFWTSGNDDIVVCEGVAFAECDITENPRCDSIFHQEQQDCSISVGFTNLHIPRGNIDGFRVRVLTTGGGIDTATAPQGWDVASQSALTVRFAKQDTPIGSGETADGFTLRFKAPTGRFFDVAICTMLDDAVICCDTIQLECDPPPPTFCYSLLIDAVPNTCTYDLGFVNTHQPTSAVNDFHVRLQTDGASIADASPPGNWFIASNDGRNIIFRDTTGIVLPDEEQSGFMLSLAPGDGDGRIIFEWCTSLDGTVNCCDIASVFCDPPVDRCDSLYVLPGEGYCQYEAGFANLHVPVSGVDAFHVTLDDAETMLLDAEAPDGWTIDELSEGGATFVIDGAALSTGVAQEGFILKLLPSAQSKRIPLTLCTSLDDSTLCCDTVSVFCEFEIVQCDVIDVITDIDQACCFEFELQNVHLPRSGIDALNVEILTPDVIFYTSTVEDAAGWEHLTNSRRIGWRALDAALPSGETLGGFKVCYDNDAIGNADFQISVQTLSSGRILCIDTLTIKCDRTLSVERLEGMLPSRYGLHQNYPNPFNPSTTIEFDLPVPADVILSLYDTEGRLLMDLGSGNYLAGTYRVSLDASSLPSGVYFYQLRTSEFIQTRSLLLLR
ncbi:MAG: hypothetical protein C0600_03125 [Ignavibacteria bacterium]|nr:MAG: hypothetical protein C0600_03125 [Ignavibacteria bacterium]